ncbi:MAG TPA: hypothetical protein VJ869_02395 [Sphaerochaeta sp.]|nr:hypothetical protein [Sphaerochaeta sp.]
MSLLKVDKIQPRTKDFLELEDVKVTRGTIDTDGSTNLGKAAEKDTDFFFSKSAGANDKYAMFQNGELVESGFGTADTGSLETRIGVAEGLIAGLGSGGPKGTYADLGALNLADPDHSEIYLTLDDGHWAYYDTSAFVDSGQVYSDSAALSDLAGAGRTVETVKDNADLLVAHKESNMPHRIVDLEHTKTYTFGLQLSAEGQPQIIMEELV